nr:reverse transcriptase domain-containing protein [Tanacetum cinerariifolium]
MRIPLLYQGEYSQWVERFMNYLEEQIDGEAMINSIKNGLPNDIYSLIDSNKTAKDLWDALVRHMIGSEYGEQDRKAAVLYEIVVTKDKYELNFKFLNNLQPEWKQYATMMRQNKNLMDINIDALYNILKQNQGDVNDAMGSKKKTLVVTSDLLALIAKEIKVSKTKKKVVVSSDSEGSDADDFNELKKIPTLLANTDNKRVENKDDEKKRDMSRVKCYNCKKEGHFVKDCKKVKVKDYEYYKTKMLLAKKDKDKQVLLAEDQAWMESSSDSDQEINANMVFMAQIKKVLYDSTASSSSADEKIFKKRVEKANQQSKDFENQTWIYKINIRQCPHHGFSELHQLDTFYNALNPNDQDALDSAAGGNVLDRIPRECLSIIESKSKVRYSRSRVTDSRVSTNAPLPSSSPSNSFDV